ncbi:MAG: nucleoside triphosphate pyrophosphatase [Pseudomonadales bacterium]
MAKLILASSSRYRAELLSRLGVPFTAVRPDVDESPLPDESPEALVARLAERKARTVAAVHPDALIIGSDQVAVCRGEVLGKPGSPDRAREQLRVLSGQTVRFLTSLCLLDGRDGRLQLDVNTTRVRFRQLTAAEIANYVAREQPIDCAGAFKSEALGVALLDAIEGDDPNALIGLPLIRLCAMLREAGCDVLA